MMDKKFVQPLDEAKNPLDIQAAELLHLKRDLASIKKGLFTASNSLRSADLHWLGSAKLYHDKAVSELGIKPFWNANLDKKLTEAKKALDEMYEAIDDAEIIAELQIRSAKKQAKGK